MNRSILIVICDFLLVSLLAFSTADLNSAAQGGTPQMPMTNLTMRAATNQTGAGQDLGDVMRLALTDERKNRDALMGELYAARGVVSNQQALLSERDAQVLGIRAQLESSEAQARQAGEEQTNLEKQFTDAQAKIQDLAQELHASTVETVLTKEERAAMEAEAQRQRQSAAELQAQLDQLQKTNEVIAADKERLAGQLQLAETDKRMATAQLAKVEDEVAARREENAKLAASFNVLATNSTALADEIREEHPLTANEIFDEVSANRVQTHVSASRTGILGGAVEKSKRIQTVLVTDGTNTFAVCHVHDTPLTLWNPGTDWREMTAALDHGSTSVSPATMAFSLIDPRIVLVPVTAAQISQLGCKLFHVTGDPFKFQDAVVIGTSEEYYGECKFQIDLNEPFYLKMDHNSLKGLFGKFNPSRGDLVFSKAGDFLGIMANSTYCAVVRDADAAATLNLGARSRDQGTGETLSALYTVVTDLPLKLQ